MEPLTELVINLANEYFKQKNKTEMTAAEAIAKLQAITAQAIKVNGELTKKLAEKDTQIADLQQQVANGTDNVPDDVVAQIDSVGEQIQALDDLTPDADNAGGDTTDGGTTDDGGVAGV